MSEKYIGVTIGPVFDTVNLTSSPAALWAASYMFSKLTRTLCDVLTEHNVPADDILSPSMDNIGKVSDGVGLYHDRIVFRKGSFNINDFTDVRKESVKRIAAAFFEKKDQTDIAEFLNSYLLIAAAEFEADNPLKESDPILNSLELARPFATKREINPILALFTNNDPTVTEEGEAEKIGANEAVKVLMQGFTNFQLKKRNAKDGNIVLKSLADIAGADKHTGKKTHQYFAIVRSDGDSISNLIAQLETDTARRNFSCDCMRFCQGMATLVAQYAGVTIYAGGDDLLALLPCETADAKTPFEFIAEANALFKEHFKTEGKYPKAVQDKISLSFSVTMSFYKFPLYEALQTSQSLLFDRAKTIKNGAVIYLQKHSGQSEGVFVSNDSLAEVTTFKERIVEQNEDVLMSALYKLELFEKLLCEATEKDEITNLFANLFDSASHTDNNFVHEVLPDLFYRLQSRELCVYALDSEGIHTGAEPPEDPDKKKVPAFAPVKALCYLMRIGKFFIEKEGKS